MNRSLVFIGNKVETFKPFYIEYIRPPIHLYYTII